MATTETAPPERLIDGKFIERDLLIAPRTRRKLVAAGLLPEPAGYIGRMPRWRLADYLAAREQLLARKRLMEDQREAA